MSPRVAGRRGADHAREELQQRARHPEPGAQDGHEPDPRLHDRARERRDGRLLCGASAHVRRRGQRGGAHAVHGLLREVPARLEAEQERDVVDALRA
jgi:hypothetical protein